jgi:hypothetical protein
MDWPTIRTALQTAIASVIAVDTPNIVWRGSLEEGSRVYLTRVVLSANSIVTAGVDENRYEAQGSDNQLVEFVGQRRFTWSIQIECQNQTDGTARVLMDQVRIRLRRDSVAGPLRDVGLSIANFLATQERDFEDDGRMISWASMDVLMNATDVDQDTSPDAGDWIGEAISDGTVSDGTDHAVHVDVDAR